ncbi:MAG TPA: hypothetical protein DDZ39_11925 [Flavobacteriaceae bacterium]|nr:hypothetical protein [Flavobacteriaceae bacterium]HBS13081.1 hypothetical protein [Flavobacteriaceae bacterium]
MRSLLFTLLFLVSLTGFSQIIDKQPSFWDNVQFGGGLGIGIGSNRTTISVAPSAIYNFNPQFSLGIGASYLYSKNNTYKSNVFGASILSFYNPLEQLQISAEFEHLFVSQKSGTLKFPNYDYPALYLGAAYRVGNFSAGLRYDVLYNENKSIYASAFSPIFRFYF